MRTSDSLYSGVRRRRSRSPSGAKPASANIDVPGSPAADDFPGALGLADADGMAQQPTAQALPAIGRRPPPRHRCGTPPGRPDAPHRRQRPRRRAWPPEPIPGRYRPPAAVPRVSRPDRRERRETLRGSRRVSSMSGIASPAFTGGGLPRWSRGAACGAGERNR